MFKFERIIINPEYQDSTREILEKQRAKIEALLNDSTKRLGEGRTAEVYFVGSNNEICLKIYKKSVRIPQDIYYVSPTKELEFLEAVDNLGTRARAPKAYACYEDKEDDGYNFLMMETLSAVSLDDILQGRADLPAGFNLAEFSKSLRDFVQKMHESGIYHRDLHEGNIMIDKTTGAVYIIDFGAATSFPGEPEPGENGPYHITQGGQTIKLTSDEVMIKQVTHKIAEQLTVSN